MAAQPQRARVQVQVPLPVAWRRTGSGAASPTGAFGRSIPFHGGKRGALERRAAILLELKTAQRGSRGATVGDLLQAWLRRCEDRFKAGDLAENTLMNYRYQVRRLQELAPAFLTLKLESLDTAEPVEGLLQGLEAAGVREAGRVQTFNALRAAFEWGIGRKWIRWNPAKYVDSKPTPPQKSRNKLTVDEVRKLVELAPDVHPDLPAYILVAALTGLRRQALLGLRWSDVDLDRQELAVNRVVNEVWGHVRVESQAKSRRGKPAPVKWLDPVAVSMLRSLRSAQQRRCGETGTSPRADGWVFASDGLGFDRFSPNHMQHLVERVAERVGLPHRSHDLRHHRASELIASGVDPARVAEELDHGSADFTLRTYVGPTRPAGDGRMSRIGENYVT